MTEIVFRLFHIIDGLMEDFESFQGILEDAPCTPKHNRISNNVLCGGVQNFSLDPATVEGWGSEMYNNTAIAECPSSWPL